MTLLFCTLKQKEVVSISSKPLPSMPYRLAVYLTGVFLLSIGVNLSIIANLGVAPINSLPYVLSQCFGIQMGLCITIVFTCMVLIQVMLLGKKFQPFQLLQLPVSAMFGIFVDFGAVLVSPIVSTGFLSSLGLLVCSTVLMSLGLTLYIRPNLAPMPVEGLSLALSQRFGHPFHRMKISLDCTFITCSSVIALCAFGNLTGIGIGSLLMALLVGPLVPVCSKVVDKILGPA